MSKKVIYLIDATAFCYRAFYALKGLSTTYAQPTNAIYGFVNMLNKIMKEHKPQFLGVCFDVSRDTFRSRKFSAYKIQRPPMPDDLSSQMPFIKDIIKAYGLTILEKEGYEADDIIAAVSGSALADGFEVLIVSSDKDMLQLVKPGVKVLSPHKDEDIIYDEDKVFSCYGVKPSQIPDVISLMGDSVDNIPSVPGIGEKTAVELIKRAGSVEKIIDEPELIKSEKIRSAVERDIEKIKLNKELAYLSADVKIDFDIEELKVRKQDAAELFKIFQKLEFKKFIQGLDIPDDKEASKINIKVVKDSQVPSIRDNLFLYGSSQEDTVFCADNSFFKVERWSDNTKSILANPALRKISHDLKKVKVSFSRQEVELAGFSFDTMLAAHLLNPSKTYYSLSDISWDYDKQNISLRPADNVSSLNLICRLKGVLESELSDKSLLDLFNNIEIPLAEVLAGMEIEGIKIDSKMLKELSLELNERLTKLIEEIYDCAGSEFNINSPKQLRQVLFENLKLPVVRRSKTGPSTDEEVLRALSDKHQLPALLLEYRQLTKLKNTYIDIFPELVDKKTGRIHTSFNQTGTETGRLSSSNPNLQNIPVKTDIGKKIRKAIISFDKDSILLSADYSQIELRILAHLSKDESLISAFRNQEDVHCLTASLIYGVDIKDVSDAMRDTAKRINFGIIYGLSAYGLSRDLSIPLQEAQAFIEAYFNRYPKVQDYINKQIRKAQEDGFVTTLLGRRRYIPEIKDKSQQIRQFAERKAINTPVQGSASDLIKLAMIKIDEDIKNKKFKSRMILQIHDELLFNVYSDEAKDFKKLVRKRMENVLRLDVPVRVDIKTGKNWLEMESV